MIAEIISVEYEESTGLWLTLDNWHDVIGEGRKKKNQIPSARNFAKGRARAVGGKVKLEIYNKDGSLGRENVYEP